MKQWHLEDVDTIPKDGSAVLVDVRTADEFSRGCIEGFKNIPVDELEGTYQRDRKGKAGLSDLSEWTAQLYSQSYSGREWL